MPEKPLAKRCAELEEKLRLLAIENDHLAGRAEETLLLGLISEKVSASADADELIQVGLEQVAVLRNIPYVGCYAIAEEQAWLVHEYTLAQVGEAAGVPILLSPAVLAGLDNGGCILGTGEQAEFRFLARAGAAFTVQTAILLPLRNRHGRPLVFVFATDDVDGNIEGMKTLLLRVVEMIGSRIENLALLDQLTHMNESLDQKVHERTEELRASETRLRALFEGAIDAFFVVDEEMKIRDVNARACENLGYTRAELLGMSAMDIRDDRGERGIREVVRGAAAGEIPAVDAWHRRQDGSTFPVEVRACALEIDGESMLLAQARDVSERNRLLEQLHQSQKMEAVGRLAGGIAHDFNNILTAIMGQLDLLKMDLSADATALEDLDLIQQSAERAAGLTRQLLAFSRKQVLDMRPQDLSQCVAATSRMLLRVIDETVNLKLELADESAHIYGDQVQIEQILMNLVINARDAMSAGGDITIATNRVGSQNEFLVVHPDAPPATGQYWVLRVTDTGEGIPPEILGKIFDPFFTTKEVGKGTGLGLALVYSLAQQHHARVRVQSEVGRGTTFEVVFPEIVAPDGVADDVAAGATPHGDETILLVEDDVTIRAVISRMIEKLGYKLLVAADGVEALEVATGHGGAVDLVLTDVIMPTMGGADLVHELNSRFAPMRVIYMSGYTDDKVGRADLAMPGARFLQKPVSFAALASELRQSLDCSLDS